MPTLVVIAIVIVAAIAIPVSVKYLGANNPIEEAAETVIKDELPAAETDLPSVAADLEAAMQAAPADTPQATVANTTSTQ